MHAYIFMTVYMYVYMCMYYVHVLHVHTRLCMHTVCTSYITTTPTFICSIHESFLSSFLKAVVGI